jgi:hypothetical protein
MRHRHDDDNILKDGERLRVPMTLMDGIQQAVARESLRVTDGAGKTVGLHRPGFRLSATDARSTDLDVYAEYEKFLVDSWKTPSITGAGERGQVGAREGDLCTIDGRPGHLKKVNGELSCVPDAQQDHQQRMAQLYDARDLELSQEWRAHK